jgi:hypothetical protein
VNDDDGRPRRSPAPGPHVDQDFAEDAGQAVLRESGGCHVES